MWIERLSVTGFRGIDELKIQTKPINVFVGRNNTGKSSILEAVTIAATSPTGYVDALNQEIVLKILSKENNLSYWVKMGYEEAKIQVEDRSGRTYEIIIQYYDKGLGEKYATMLMPLIRSELLFSSRIESYDKSEFEQRLQRATEKMVNMPKLSLIDEKSLAAAMVLFDTLRGKLRMIREITPSPSHLFYIGTAHRPDITTLYNSTVQLGLFPFILSMLKEQISYLRDMRTIRDKLFVDLDGLDRPIPISMAGDGFQALLRSAFAMALAKDGTLVLEEPETNLHPGFVELIARYIAEHVEKNNVQVFLSTHSMEFLDSLLENAEEITQVVRMHLSQGRINYEILSGKEARYEEEQLRLDLRGA